MNTFLFILGCLAFCASLRLVVPHTRRGPCGMDFLMLALCILAARSFNR